MSEKWTMPDWMREGLLACDYIQGDIDRADKHYNADKQSLSLSTLDGFMAMSDTIVDLVQLRSAGLLLTQGQKESMELDVLGYEAAIEDAGKQITRLRAENEKMRAALAHYAECGDGCTCGDGWSHNIALAALGADHD